MAPCPSCSRLVLINWRIAWMFAMMYSLYLALKSLKKGWPKILIMPAITILIIWLLSESFLFEFSGT